MTDLIHEQHSLKRCAVRVIGDGVDSFYVVESEDDLETVVALIRKAANLKQHDISLQPFTTKE
jgi:hypothetical protein